MVKKMASKPRKGRDVSGPKANGRTSAKKKESSIRRLA